MAKNIMPFNLDVKKLIEKYKKIVYADDAFESTLLFNRIMDIWQAEETVFEPFNATKDEINSVKNQLKKCLAMLNSEEQAFLMLRQVTVYGRINAHGMEIDNLLKVLACDDFGAYDKVAVLNRLTTFFGFMMGIDVYDHYLKLLRDRFPDDERLKFMEKPSEKIANRGIHFVDDMKDGTFNAVLSKMVQGDYDGALNEISNSEKIQEKDFKVKNLEVAMLLSMGAVDKARKILDELDKAGCRDVEFYANFYQLAKQNPEVIENTIKLIEIDVKLKTSYDLKVILASLYCMSGKYQEAAKVLTKIKGVKKDGREALKLLAECYYSLQDEEKLIGILRKIIALFPYDIWARYYLINNKFDLKANINKFQPDAINELKKFVLEKTKTMDSFNEIDRRDAIFIFKALEEIRESAFSKEIIEKIYFSQHKQMLFDALLSVQTDLVTAELIFQVLIEEGYEDEFYALKDCQLRKFKLELPQSLMDEGTDKDKLRFLISCYAQTYSLMFYLGFELDNINVELDSVIARLKDKDLLKDELLFRAECVVFLLSNALHFENEYIDETFRKLKKTEKKKLLEILNEIK